MKRFKFRLEKVLQYREILKAEKKRALGMKLAILHDAEKRLRDLFAEQAANNMPAGTVEDANQFFLRGQYSTRLKEAIAKQRVAIAEAEAEVEKARAEYVEAAKEVKTLDMLKARKKEQYDELLRQDEAKFLDEIVTQRAQRAQD